MAFERARTPAPLKPADLDLGLLFERSLDAIVVARLSSGEIALWNQAAERLFGYTAKEAIGRPIEMLMAAGMAALHRNAVARYRRTGRGLIMNAAAPVEVPGVTSQGATIRVQVSLSELTSPRGERFVLAVMRDASHRQELELLRLEVHRLRRTSDVLLTALASTPHDVEVHRQDHDAAGDDGLPLLRHRQDA